MKNLNLRFLKHSSFLLIGFFCLKSFAQEYTPSVNTTAPTTNSASPYAAPPSTSLTSPPPALTPTPAPTPDPFGQMFTQINNSLSQIASIEQQILNASGNKSFYNGFSMNFLSTPVSPFRVDAQDLNAAASSYALNAAPTPSSQPIPTLIPSNLAAKSLVTLTAASPVVQTVGTIISTQIPGTSVDTSAAQLPQVVTTTTSINPYTVSGGTVNSQSLEPGQEAINPSSVAMLDVSNLKNPSNNMTAAQQLIGLLSGTYDPQPVFTQNEQKQTVAAQTPADSYSYYIFSLNRLAAISGAVTATLNDILKRNSATISPSQAGLGSDFSQWLQINHPDMVSAQNVSRAVIEEYIATRRLNPNWYTALQGASSIKLQREQLYLEADMLHEIYMMRQQQEQTNLLLTLSLAAQTASSKESLYQITNGQIQGQAATAKFVKK